MEALPKSNGWKRIVMTAAGALAVMCVLCVAIVLIYFETPAGKASLAETRATLTAVANTTAVAAVEMTRAVPAPTTPPPSPTTATHTIAPSLVPTEGLPATTTKTSTPTATAKIPTRTLTPSKTLLPTTTSPTPVPTVTIDMGAAGLPGLLPADVRVNVEDRFGLVCDRPKIQSGITTWTCIRDVGTAVLRVDIYSQGGLQVDIIDARIAGFFNAETAANFLGFVATMPYDGADPAAARLWVATNITKARAETIIGNVWFELSGNDSLRELIMSEP